MKRALILMLALAPALALAEQPVHKAKPKPKLAVTKPKPAPAKPAAPKSAAAKPVTPKPVPPKPAPAVAVQPVSATTPKPITPPPLATTTTADAAAAIAATSMLTPPPSPEILPAASFVPDLDIMHAQVILDRLGFAPGVIDGRKGKSLVLALKGFQGANGLAASGTLDAPTLAALGQYKDMRPIEVLTLGQADLLGTFLGPLPHGYAIQAALPCLCYANVVEMLAERYHTTPATLAALNPGVTLAAGQLLKVPAIGTGDHAYAPGIPGHFKATLIGLNVAATQVKGDHIVVSKSAGSLSVYDFANKLVAQFPVTTGSVHDPLPLGEWKIQGTAFNPTFHYNPQLFWDAKKGDKKAMLPAGPNGPVGVAWIDLSKDHYGIHGTPNPATIGRSESHGCIRLANWDVARLSLMVKPGMPARFVE